MSEKLTSCNKMENQLQCLEIYSTAACRLSLLLVLKKKRKVHNFPINIKSNQIKHQMMLGGSS
ncbi:hypothetical protein T4D_177 [Trichinella pseudospiralis]|uniref:Uncharacterized protein n=1 Tax=Trichinella pseudospiralis TaxID=6337 RepID=A0A0V1FQB3_TRIPS|nr:hypothetical protein T4D_177 [Trichinella pseudospiralis]